MKITKRQLKRIINETCGVSLEKDSGNVYGHGGTARMAKSQLFQIATDAAELHDMLDEKDELPEWVQSKIAVMAHSMDAVSDHLEYKALDQAVPGDVVADDFVGVQFTEAVEYGTPEYDIARDDLDDALRNAFANAKEAGLMDMDIKDAIADALDYVREML